MRVLVPRQAPPPGALALGGGAPGTISVDSQRVLACAQYLHRTGGNGDHSFLFFVFVRAAPAAHGGSQASS